MKKSILFISSAVIAAAPAMTVVACGSTNSSSNSSKHNESNQNGSNTSLLPVIDPNSPSNKFKKFSITSAMDLSDEFYNFGYVFENKPGQTTNTVNDAFNAIKSLDGGTSMDYTLYSGFSVSRRHSIGFIVISNPESVVVNTPVTGNAVTVNSQQYKIIDDSTFADYSFTQLNLTQAARFMEVTYDATSKTIKLTIMPIVHFVDASHNEVSVDGKKQVIGFDNSAIATSDPNQGYYTANGTYE